MEKDGLTEQKVIIEIRAKLGKNLLKIHEMLNTVYGDNALKEKARFK